MFPVGSVYTPGFYMSTSLDPTSFAPPYDGGITIYFEIKAKKAASLATVASQGTNEKEFLLPRDKSYRVISNNTKVVVDKGEEDERILTIFQLEEI
jgi:hypothetical protein